MAIDLNFYSKHIIDLEHSVLDKEKSNIEKNIYEFKKKIYYRKDKSPAHALKWGTTAEGGRLAELWKTKWNFDFVTKGGRYLPEGVKPNAEGHYVLGDAVLMQCPIDDYAKKQRESMDESRDAVKHSKARFTAETRKHKAEVKDEMVGDILGA